MALAAVVLGLSTGTSAAQAAPVGSTTSSTTTSSAWTEPPLVNPQTIVLSNTNRSLTLSQSQDYILKCPGDSVSLQNALTVWGGHNVVLQNCDLNVTSADWAGHFKNQTGTLFVHDDHFAGTQLTGGIQLQEPGTTTVVMRDVLFDTMHGSYSTNHAECLQTWSGPQRLLIDGMTCPTTYQGLFLLPNQWDTTTTETTWDLRNIDIPATGAYALWLGNVQPSNHGSIPIWNTYNLYVSGPGEPRTWDGTSDNGAAWSKVHAGTPPNGHFARATSTGATGSDENPPPTPLPSEQ